jgi:hypothetical protein
MEIMRRILLGVAAAALTLLLAGCSGLVITGAADVNKQAFGERKRFAVVTIASHRNFSGERAIFDLFKDPQNVAGANTQPLIDKLGPRIVGALGRSGHFNLVPEARVLGHRAYRATQEDPRVRGVAVFSSDLNVAQGYRYFSEPAKYARLAQDLGVDGVIAVEMQFSVSTTSGGANINGFALGAKTYSATATASAVAYNQKGEMVWKDSTTKQAERGDMRAVVVIDTSMFTGTDFVKLHPSAVEIGGKAIDVLVARFDDTMAGRPVERVQGLK